MSNTNLARAFSFSFALVIAAGACSRGDSHDRHHAAHSHGHGDAHAQHRDGAHAHREDDAHGDHHDEHAPASFEPGRGLRLAAETARAIGLESATAAERRLSHRYQVTASVFDPGPPVLASSLVPAAVADAMERHPPRGASVVSVRRDLSGALNQAEVVLALSESPAGGTTREVPLEGPERTVLAVPRSAVLRTAGGTFVYAVNDEHLLRTPVATGTRDSDFVEITGGLKPGDVVATGGVEQLWLTELRLTKGGGHSH